MRVLPISLCIFVKNEEDNILACVESVRPAVSEVVIVDTGSTDRTLELARSITERVYQVPFTNFGAIRTITSHLASYPWVLMLDADERLSQEDWPLLGKLISVPVGTPESKGELDTQGNVVTDSYALPRKRWADPLMQEQVDVSSYPDWQVRLFYNHNYRNKISYVRRVHETVVGCVKTHHCVDGPTINHFQNNVKTRDDLLRRQTLYETLHNLDTQEGIVHTEPVILEIDKVL